MPAFGDLEAAIMDILWKADTPLFVRDVRERLDRDLAYTTVQTVMEILHRKGWMTRDRFGRAFRYAATASRDEYVSGLVREALSLTDDRAAVLIGFVEQMGADEAAALERVLAAARRRDVDS